MSRELQAIAVLLMVLAVAWVGYGLIFGDDGAARLTVTSVEGRVLRIDGLGQETDAASGQELSPRERIVAGEGARAVLSFGPDSRVTVEERSAVRVVALDESGVRLELEGGRVQATVRPGSGPLGITSDGRAVNADDADFTAVRGADGTLGVEAQRGSVTLDGIEGPTRLNEGERLVAAPGGSAFVASTTEELLLNVAWPVEVRTREVAVEVHGRTEPGASVRIGREGAWVVVSADATGTFSARPALAEGANDLRVEATSVMGASAGVSNTVVRDTLAPSIGVEIRY